MCPLTFYFKTDPSRPKLANGTRRSAHGCRSARAHNHQIKRRRDNTRPEAQNGCLAKNIW